jgi:hypothetical protein
MVVSVESVWVTSGTEALATRSTAMRPKIGYYLAIYIHISIREGVKM